MKNNKKDFIYNKHNKKDTRFNTKGNLYDRVKNILSWVLIGCVLLSLVGSILGTIAFSKDCKTAKADTVSELYSFEGSSMFFPVRSMRVRQYGINQSFRLYGVYNSWLDTYEEYSAPVALIPGYNDYLRMPFFSFVEQYNKLNVLNSAIKFEQVINDAGTRYISVTHTLLPSVGLIDPNSNGYYDSLYRIPLHGFYTNTSQDIVQLDSSQSTSFNVFSDMSYYFCYSTSGDLVSFPDSTTYTGYPCVALFRYKIVGSFNCNVQKVAVGSWTRNGSTGVNDDDIYVKSMILNRYDSLYYQANYFMDYNYIRYYDNNGNYFELSSPISGNKYFLDTSDSVLTGNLVFNDRIYYLLNGENGNISAEITEAIDNYKNSEQFYDDATSKFYNEWKNTFSNSSEFKDIARARYYSIWFGEGVSSANDYTFFSLVSAPVDAVLQGFFGNGSDDTGLLNFELLGINFKSLFSGLFTLAVILWIVKFVTQQKT